MSPEAKENNNAERYITKEELLEKTEELLNMRPTKLPQSVAKEIRRMKQDGRLSEAYARRAAFIREKSEKRVLARLDDELGDTMLDIIENQDAPFAADHIRRIVKAVWLLDLKGFITAEERLEDLRNVLDEHPKVVEELGGELRQIREEAEAIALRSK